MTKDQINQEKLIDEADAWVVRLRSDSLSDNDKQRFSIWLNTSTMHIQAFDEACELWEKTDAVKYLPMMDAIQDASSDSLHAPRNKPGNILSQLLAKLTIQPLYLTQPLHLTSICIVAILIIACYINPGHQALAPKLYESAIGQTKIIHLQDGSQLELNTQTKLLVNYSSEQRHITLVHGEAFFRVANDKQRPFIVDFGKGTVTALGTTFNIFKQNGLSSVTVSKGIVAVRESADLVTPEPLATKLYANQHVYVSPRGISPVKHTNSARNIAWREGIIEFKNTPLKHALDELNRYLHTPVNINASEVEDLHVSGTFSLHTPIKTLNAISKAFALEFHSSNKSNTLALKD